MRELSVPELRMIAGENIQHTLMMTPEEAAKENRKTIELEKACRLTAMEDMLFAHAHRNIEAAKELSLHLASIDWQEYVLRKDQKEKEEANETERLVRKILANGGGYCKKCKEISNRLFHVIPEDERYQSWEGDYCSSCLWNVEKGIVADENRRGICKSCGDAFFLRDSRDHEKVKASYNGYCSPCFDKKLSEAFTVCDICGIRTLDYSQRGTCDDCYIKYPEKSTVNYHNNRARALGLEATLTVPQWQAAVTCFDSKCAYCLTKPYTVLEHFIPLTKKGGTTATNCVPACQGCNSRKNGTHPDKLIGFPTDNLARIRSYLASVTQQVA